MPVEFLADDQAVRYGRYVGVPSRAELERYFFLDDEDMRLVARRHGEANRNLDALRSAIGYWRISPPHEIRTPPPRFRGDPGRRNVSPPY
jgi:hypothetical protein